MPDADSEAFTIAIHDFGGEGPDLVFAHATGFHGLAWAPMAERLATDFHCVAFDERGHGCSDVPPDDDFSWNSFTDDLLTVIDGFPLRAPLHGIGHSCGGALLLLAEQRRPGLFRSLYVYEPIVFPDDGSFIGPPGGGNPLADGARKRREIFESADAAYDDYASKPPLEVLDPDALRAYVDHGFEKLADGTVRLRCRGESEARTYEMSREHSGWDHLGEVACPVTVACGNETFGPAAMAPRIVDRLPNGRLEKFDHLGHFGPLQDPVALAAAARSALLA